MKNFVEILLPVALNESFTYFSEEKLEIGDVVMVEFGKRKIWGVLVKNLEKEPKIAKIKPILEKNHRISLKKSDLDFINKLSEYNLATKGLVLRAFIGILNSDKVKKEPVARIQEIDDKKFKLKTLSEEQKEVADEILESRNSVSLIDGVTGSGKTEVYFSIIAKLLSESSSQILILLPEIALTSQLLLRFEEQFGFKPALWHSKITKKEKREIFYGVLEGSIKVLIGARSSLLLPFKKLGLIIIDEEHDQSLKQEDVFNFHARDMAILKSNIEKFPIILSTATPAIETYVNATCGKYNNFVLSSKFAQSKNKVELIDLRREKLEKDEFLSNKLRGEIVKNLENNKQSLLFLNRRGFAPVTLCKSCGKKYDCLNCDFHLVLHKSKNKLICHHCGEVEQVPVDCKFCGEPDALVSVGVGVEKLEEEVKRVFPTARIALITSDNITNFVEIEKIVKEILDDKIDIIIGTQMIVKGHDFPNLELVGIVDVDGMLYSSELKALERAYQTLTQVVGRAGRKKAGKVFIQTYNPKNFIFEKIIKDEKEKFYDFEVNNRKILNLPPFARMTKFEISSFNEYEAKNFAKTLIKSFPINDKIEFFGPASAPIQRLKNRHHFLVNVKADKKINLQKLIKDVLKTLKVPNSIRLRINIDPI